MARIKCPPLTKLQRLVRYRSDRLPEEWQALHVFFKETIFTGSCQNRCIECLWYDREHKKWHVSTMDMEWCRCIPCAVFLETIPEL